MPLPADSPHADRTNVELNILPGIILLGLQIIAFRATRSHGPREFQYRLRTQQCGVSPNWLRCGNLMLLKLIRSHNAGFSDLYTASITFNKP